MKLPTLNVDVAVNTKTMQKGIAEANKKLEQVGKKGLSFAGGTFGKVGGLAELGGGFGQAAIGGAGIALAAFAPIKAAGFIVDSFAEATKRGEDAMKSFAEGKGLTGNLDLGTASRLAAGAQMERANQMATGGLWDTFLGSMANEQGQVGGIAGAVKEWAQATAEGTKWLVTWLGGQLGGLNEGEAADRADMAISRSAAGAQAYMTTQQINAAAAQAEKNRKAEREQNT